MMRWTRQGDETDRTLLYLVLIIKQTGALVNSIVAASDAGTISITFSDGRRPHDRAPVQQNNYYILNYL